MTPIPKLLEIGSVGRAHGVRGELKVRTHWAGSSALGHASQLWLQREGEPPQAVSVESARSNPKGALLKLAGVDSREAAEELTGARLLADRSELPALAEGEYYLADLVGVEVFAPGGIVGVVERIGLYPTMDTLVIAQPDGGQVEQMLQDEWIETVDLVARRVELKSLDGLIQ